MSEEASASEQNSGRPVPVLTEDMRTRARQSPGTWLYAVDPAYDPDGAVPPYAIIGAWPVDGSGEPGDFTPNPRYRPSSTSLMLTDATDPVDAAMQLAATGHGHEAVVLDALADTTVYLVTNSEGDLTAYQDENGPHVMVLTDPRQAHPVTPRLLPVAILDLLELLPDETALWINPESDVSMGVSSAQLRAALDSRGATDTAEAARPTLGIPFKGGQSSGRS